MDVPSCCVVVHGSMFERSGCDSWCIVSSSSSSRSIGPEEINVPGLRVFEPDDFRSSPSAAPHFQQNEYFASIRRAAIRTRTSSGLRCLSCDLFHGFFHGLFYSSRFNFFTLHNRRLNDRSHRRLDHRSDSLLLWLFTNHFKHTRRFERPTILRSRN